MDLSSICCHQYLPRFFAQYLFFVFILATHHKVRDLCIHCNSNNGMARISKCKEIEVALEYFNNTFMHIHVEAAAALEIAHKLHKSHVQGDLACAKQLVIFLSATSFHEWLSKCMTSSSSMLVC